METGIVKFGQAAPKAVTAEEETSGSRLRRFSTTSQAILEWEAQAFRKPSATFRNIPQH